MTQNTSLINSGILINSHFFITVASFILAFPKSTFFHWSTKCYSYNELCRLAIIKILRVNSEISIYMMELLLVL